MPLCQIDLSLCDLANENPETAKHTDGLKTDFGTSSSFYIHRFEVRRVVKLNTNASIFTAELHFHFQSFCIGFFKSFVLDVTKSVCKKFDNLFSKLCIGCHKIGMQEI